MQFLYVDLVITTSVAVLSKSAIRNQSSLNDLPYIHVARPSSFFFFLKIYSLHLEFILLKPNYIVPVCVEKTVDEFVF